MGILGDQINKASQLKEIYNSEETAKLKVLEMMQEIGSILPADKTYHWRGFTCRVRQQAGGYSCYVKYEIFDGDDPALTPAIVWKWKDGKALCTFTNELGLHMEDGVKAFYALARCYANEDGEGFKRILLMMFEKSNIEQFGEAF